MRGVFRSILNLEDWLNISIVLSGSIWVTGGLQVDWLGMSVNLLYQLPQTGYLLFIGNDGGLLGGNRKAGK